MHFESMKKFVFLGLAVLGLIGTWYFNLHWMSVGDGGSFFDFFAIAASNDPGRSLSVDIGVVGLVFFVWYIPEARRLKMKHWWVFIPLAIGVALAFAFPLFMFFREWKLEKTSIFEAGD